MKEAPTHDQALQSQTRVQAKVAMEAIRGHKTIQEITSDLAVYPIHENQWNRQRLDGASVLFTRDKNTKDKALPC